MSESATTLKVPVYASDAGAMYVLRDHLDAVAQFLLDAHERLAVGQTHEAGVSMRNAIDYLYHIEHQR